MSYSLAFKKSALKEWKKLDKTTQQQFKAKLAQRLNEPHVPASKLHGTLQNCYKIKLRSVGYRLVYEVNDRTVVVTVITVGRRDNDIYRKAAKLLGTKKGKR